MTTIPIGTCHGLYVKASYFAGPNGECDIPAKCDGATCFGFCGYHKHQTCRYISQGLECPVHSGIGHENRLALSSLKEQQETLRNSQRENQQLHTILKKFQQKGNDLSRGTNRIVNVERTEEQQKLVTSLAELREVKAKHRQLQNQLEVLETAGNKSTIAGLIQQVNRLKKGEQSYDVLKTGFDKTIRELQVRREQEKASYDKKIESLTLSFLKTTEDKQNEFEQTVATLQRKNTNLIQNLEKEKKIMKELERGIDLKMDEYIRDKNTSQRRCVQEQRELRGQIAQLRARVVESQDKITATEKSLSLYQGKSFDCETIKQSLISKITTLRTEKNQKVFAVREEVKTRFKNVTEEFNLKEQQLKEQIDALNRRIQIQNAQIANLGAQLEVKEKSFQKVIAIWEGNTKQLRDGET